MMLTIYTFIVTRKLLNDNVLEIPHQIHRSLRLGIIVHFYASVVFIVVYHTNIVESFNSLTIPIRLIMIGFVMSYIVTQWYMDFAAAKAYDHLKRQLLQDLNEAYRTVDLNDDRHGELDSDPSVVVHDNKTTTTLENQQGCNIEDGIQLNLINMRMHSQYDVKSMYPSAPSQNAF